ncbi:MAG: serine/threonine-protein kinase, partial [Rubricoccaceae bacterium]|nr:serine/threonine-protein kinase [Rubricoccaceae bacterium]
MATDALDRLERLFRAARMHPAEERAAFLDAACADDPALRAEVAALLNADREADGEAFLDTPPTALLDAAVSEAAQPNPLEGRTVGPYRVLRPLGEGGMGAVYLAVREEPFQQYVALKIIRAGLHDPEVLRRFEQERQILASLSHPGIARLLDGGVTADGLPYFAMEYVEGRPLTAYCDEHRLPIEERLRLFACACEAVHYAHQNLVLHRDLKPSNILVTPGREVKLLDFGIAKLLNPHLSSSAMPVTRTALRVMTPEYASPEQVRGEPLSTASDVYSLGIILYELLTGHRPYRLTRGTTDEIMRVVCEVDPERPSTRVVRPETILRADGETETITPVDVGEARDVSPERLQRRLRGDLDNIVLMALRKEPQRRYASAEQFSQDIDRHLRGLPVMAR